VVELPNVVAKSLDLPLVGGIDSLDLLDGDVGRPFPGQDDTLASPAGQGSESLPRAA